MHAIPGVFLSPALEDEKETKGEKGLKTHKTKEKRNKDEKPTQTKAKC